MQTTQTGRRAPLMPGSMFLGSAREIKEDILGLSERGYKELGDIVRFRLGPPKLGQEITFVFDPTHAASVLDSGSSGTYEKGGAHFEVLRETFGDGLLTTKDETWHRQKRLIQPLFTRHRIDSYAGVMGDEIESTLRTWRKRGPRTLELRSEMTSITMPIAAQLLFGSDSKEMIPVLSSSFPVLTEAAHRRALAPFRPSLRWPTPQNRRFREARATIHTICEQIIVSRGNSNQQQDDLLARLLGSATEDESLTPEEVRDQVLIFFLAGEETTATALTFSLFELGRNPELQQKARDEAKEVLDGSAVTAETVAGLKYCGQVLKEAMRLYPPVPFLVRCATEDTRLSDVLVPAGTQVAVAPWVIQRRSDLWKDPSRFNPDRFDQQNLRQIHKYAWFPFGHGQRGCLAQHFALMEATLALGMLLKEFSFENVSQTAKLTVHNSLNTDGALLSMLSPL